MVAGMPNDKKNSPDGKKELMIAGGMKINIFSQTKPRNDTH
jgi:hypothetical protein